MVLTRSLRRLVASSVAVLFLGCQGMAIAYARVPDAPKSAAAAEPTPCHDTSRQAGNAASDKSCSSDCLSLIGSSSPSGAGVLDMTDLPAITTRIAPVVLLAGPVQLDEPLLRTEPPPLIILHCCLRN